jgi:hypothetical protein
MDFFYFEDFIYYVHQIQFDLRKYKNNFNGELKKKKVIVQLLKGSAIK